MTDFLPTPKRFGDRYLTAPLRIVWRDDQRPERAEAILEFDVVDGKLECVTATVAHTARQGLRKADLAAVDIEGAREAVVKFYTMPTKADADRGIVALLGQAEALGSDPRKAMRDLARSRRRVDAAFLEQVANVYRAGEGAPTQAVADAFGVAHRTAGLYVQRARRAGLLDEYDNGGRQ